MNDEKKGPSKLSDLFDDLQDTLENSVYNTDKTDTKETAKKPEADISEMPEISEISEKPKAPPVKTYAEKNANQDGLAAKGPENIPWEVQKDDDGSPSEQSDIDLELLKAIGIGRNENSESKKRKTEDSPTSKTGEADKPAPAERADRSASKKPPPKTFYKATDKEFANREQINDIFESYRNEYIAAFIRLAAGTVLFLALLYMETAPYLKWKMPGIFNIYHYNLPYIWIDMQILVLAAAINYKSLIYGVRSMFASNINVYSVAVFFLAVSFIQTILTLNFRHNNSAMALYNSAAVYSMVMISLYNLLDISAEIDSFKTVSSNKQKYALCLTDPSKTQKSPRPYASVKQETELFREAAAFAPYVGGVVSAPFVANFFTRTYKDKHSGKITKYFIYISVFAALAMFIVTMGISAEKDWYNSLSAAAALMLGSIPLCSFISVSYPVFKAQKKARQIGAAFIGQKSMEESCGTPIISVYDKDIFPAGQIRISAIKVCNVTQSTIESVMQNLCVIFDKLNMPPAEKFKASANYEPNAGQNVKVIGIDEDGVCFSIDKKKMFMGKGVYISNLGLKPFDSDVDEAFVKSLGRIIFLASESEVMAKIYIAYEISPDFYDILKNIRKLNACLCIRTFDPSIDDELIAALGNTKKYSVKVLKLKNIADIYETPECVDAPLVSKESLKSLIGAVVIADKIKTLMKTNVFLQIFAFAAGLVLALILGFAGQLWGINAGHLFLFQSFWMLPMIVLLGLG
ncbi:MAG: hypothetical protein FWD23_08655 [Oscillospiraceae bacterium]|nr:hypothetical protein [Oscillospiraceae bacterium]